AHGVELHVARQRALLAAVHLDVEQSREKAGLMDLAVQLAWIDVDQHRRLLVAIEHAGHTTVTTGGPGGPLSGPVPRLGAEGDEFSHVQLLSGYVTRRRREVRGLLPRDAPASRGAARFRVPARRGP